MESNNKQWGSHFGFLMAAVGSAVGLGNLWGFPYKMGSHGGFAFLIIYLVLAVFVGYVIMMGELTIGRRSGKGAIGAYKAISEKFAIVGWMAYICPYLILSFYSMLGGWCLRYAIANIGDLFGAGWGTAGQDSGTFFTNLYLSQSTSTIYTVIFIVLTALIVMGGVSGGIEKFSKYAMPALFFMLIIVIIRSVTLPGAVEGLKFMFKPDFSVFQGTGWLSVLASAGGQMFFSLSLGMGIMITYGAYLPKETSIEKSSLIIPACDTLIALMAGVAVMPAVFAFGMEPGGGPGLLFVTLQAVFAEMGAIGPVFGFILYFLVFIAAITSSISLLEVSTAV
nr:sodium-dependent transporter [Clostridia bacterium]